MISITIDDFGTITVSGSVELYTVPPMTMAKCGPYNKQTTLAYQNSFDPTMNGSLTGTFTGAWDANATINAYSPNIFDVKPGWICNGNGVTNAEVVFVGNATNEIITIGPGHGGFQSGEFYTFTGV